MTLATIILGAAALLLLMPVLVLVAQAIAAATRARTPAEPPQWSMAPRPRVAVLMPAHDEAAVIAGTLERIVSELGPRDHVLVVADNCSDDTAAVAAMAGATVVERRCLEQRGKSFALEFGIRHLAADPPDVVIVIDADCIVEPGAIDRLAAECAALERPVQALYLMSAARGAGVGGQVAAFAWVVKNWVRPLGMRNLGLSCQLMGSGTEFPWKSIAGFPVANTEMAEDYKFGIDRSRR